MNVAPDFSQAAVLLSWTWRKRPQGVKIVQVKSI